MSTIETVADDDNEAGFTLVELLVYSLLLVIVLSIVGSLVFNTMSVNRDVRNGTQAASLGQLVATSVNNSVRQASWVSVTDLANGQYLAVRTATGGAALGWTCRSWYFDSTGAGALYTTTSATKITQPASTPTTWTLLGTGLAAPSGGKVFTKSGTGLVLDLRVAVTNRAPVLIQSTTQSRQSATESAPCL